MNSPLTAVLVGAGNRGFVYANLAVTNPELLKIVAVADPDPFRRQLAANTFGFGEEMCFENVDKLCKAGKLADAVINATMDELHLPISLPLLDLGYDMLLEKPFALNKEEMKRLVECVERNGSKVMICHVLRYSPFYYGIKEAVQNDEIGEITNIQTAEHVSYHHLSSSYIRGKWANTDTCHAPMLLAKCCHDLDLIMWFMGDKEPLRVSSFGSRSQFRKENAPKGAGNICMVDCPLVESCVYSAKRLYLDHPDAWKQYLWEPLGENEPKTIEEKAEYLKRSDFPFARCIYKCDNNIVDRQSVMLEFEGGATATHNMIGASPKPQRKIHITGTKGEIYGIMEEAKYTIAKIDPSVDADNGECTIHVVDLKANGSMDGFDAHGGGDLRLARDFVSYMRGELPSLACTSIFDSVKGHMAVFLAEESRHSGQVVNFN